MVLDHAPDRFAKVWVPAFKVKALCSVEKWFWTPSQMYGCVATAGSQGEGSNPQKVTVS